MENIERIINGDSVTFKLHNKLTSITANELKDESLNIIKDCKELIFDFEDLHYVSSAGLRVILEIHKLMEQENKILNIINVDQGIKDIFVSTGLARFLNIK